MTTLAEKISKEALALSETERATIAQLLIESIDGDAAPDAASAWDAELQRRLSDVVAGKAKGRPAAEVFAEIQRQHAR